MTILLVSVHIFVSLFLIIVILLQAGRGQGLSWGTFGGTPQSILGTKTASFFTRLTTICAFLFLFTCIGLNVVETQKSKSLLSLNNAQSGVSQVDIEKIKKALEDVKQKEKESRLPNGEKPTETEKKTESSDPEKTVNPEQSTQPNN